MKKCTTFYHQENNTKSEIFKDVFEKKVKGCKKVVISEIEISVVLPNGEKITEEKIISYLNTLPNIYSDVQMQEMADSIKEIGFAPLSFSDDTNRPHIIS